MKFIESKKSDFLVNRFNRAIPGPISLIAEFLLDRQALPRENQVKAGAGALTISSLMRNWLCGILPIHNSR
jgi:hypothetical protein